VPSGFIFIVNEAHGKFSLGLLGDQHLYKDEIQLWGTDQQPLCRLLPDDDTINHTNHQAMFDYYDYIGVINSASLILMFFAPPQSKAVS